MRTHLRPKLTGQPDVDLAREDMDTAQGKRPGAGFAQENYSVDRIIHQHLPALLARVEDLSLQRTAVLSLCAALEAGGSRVVTIDGLRALLLADRDA